MKTHSNGRLSAGAWAVVVTISWLLGWVGYLIYTGSTRMIQLQELFLYALLFSLLALYVRYTSD